MINQFTDVNLFSELSSLSACSESCVFSILTQALHHSIINTETQFQSDEEAEAGCECVPRIELFSNSHAVGNRDSYSLRM